MILQGSYLDRIFQVPPECVPLAIGLVEQLHGIVQITQMSSDADPPEGVGSLQESRVLDLCEALAHFLGCLSLSGGRQQDPVASLRGDTIGALREEGVIKTAGLVIPACYYESEGI